MAVIQVKVPNWLDRICVWPVTWYRKWKYGYVYRRIYLGEGEWTILDQEDYYRLGHIKWCLGGNERKLYAKGGIKNKTGGAKTVYLHREIMKPRKGVLVDHRNRDSLDNRRENLRFATHSQNGCNSRIDKSKATSQFRGVVFRKKSGRWAANIRRRGEKTWLGSFKDEIAAAKAYDAAAREYHGEFARLNFPNLTAENAKHAERT
jgi:hypothetical protein